MSPSLCVRQNVSALLSLTLFRCPDGYLLPLIVRECPRSPAFFRFSDDSLPLRSTESEYTLSTAFHCPDECLPLPSTARECPWLAGFLWLS
jgi:hypothetical protein